MFQKAALGALVCTSMAMAANAPVPGKAYPACHVHKSKRVHFETPSSNDVLEISIGTGPCYAATLTIIVRSEYGEILYSYVDHFKRHVATDWKSVSLEDATDYVDQELTGAIESASSLPEWREPADYYDENYQELQISRADYIALRKTKRPILRHRTHYEAWRTVVYDEKAKKAVIVTAGGL